MENLIINSGAGDCFENVAEKAKYLANSKNQNVEFDFNGIKCIVDAHTASGLLFRDYCNAIIMEWESVGPNCKKEYSKEIKEELIKRKNIQEKKNQEQQKKREREEELEKDAFLKKVNGIEFKCSNKDALDKWQESNKDGYGGGIIEYAKDWGRLMQYEIGNGNKLNDIAGKTSFELGWHGITGFMYGAAVQVLSDCWVYGEDLRKWHNKEYGHEGEGVVNPAILTINI